MRERSTRRVRTASGVLLAVLGASAVVYAGESVSAAKQDANVGAPFVSRLPPTSRALPSTNTGRPFSPIGTGRPLARTGTGRPFVNRSLPPASPPASRLTFPPLPGAPIPARPAEPDAGAEDTAPDASPLELDPEASRGAGMGAGEADRDPSAASHGEPIVPPQFEDLIDRLVADGRNQLASGAAHAAEASFGGALVYAPRSSDLHLLHSLAQVATGNFDGAAEELHAAIRLRPAALSDALDVESAYGGRAGLEAAVATVDRFLEAYPLKSDARFLGAFLLLQAGDAKTARTAIESLLEHDPNYPHAARLRDAVESSMRIVVREA